MIARNAALFGDTQAAREWLAPCNARPLDLYMDSVYRVTVAGIDIAGHHFNDALGLVGRQLGEGPMARSYADLSHLYRATALELSGDVAGATEQLVRFLKGLRQEDSNVFIAGYFSSLIYVFAVHQPFGLCAHSFPAAYLQFFSSDIRKCVRWDPVDGSVPMGRPKSGRRLVAIVLLAVAVIFLALFCGALYSVLSPLLG